jgi:hypothetical protein
MREVRGRQELKFRTARRKAIEFAVNILDSANFDSIWGDAGMAGDDDAYQEMLARAQQAAVNSIRGLLR